MLLAGHGAGPQIYDPMSDPVEAAGTMVVPRYRHAAALMPDGSVVLVGGLDQRAHDPIASIQILDPATNTLSDVGAMTVVRLYPTAPTLPDGRVFRGRRHGWYERDAQYRDPGAHASGVAGSVCMAERPGRFWGRSANVRDHGCQRARDGVAGRAAEPRVSTRRPAAIMTPTLDQGPSANGYPADATAGRAAMTP